MSDLSNIIHPLNQMDDNLETATTAAAAATNDDNNNPLNRKLSQNIETTKNESQTHPPPPSSSTSSATLDTHHTQKSSKETTSILKSSKIERKLSIDDAKTPINNNSIVNQHSVTIMKQAYNKNGIHDNHATVHSTNSKHYHDKNKRMNQTTQSPSTPPSTPSNRNDENKKFNHLSLKRLFQSGKEALGDISPMAHVPHPTFDDYDFETASIIRPNRTQSYRHPQYDGHRNRSIINSDKTSHRLNSIDNRNDPDSDVFDEEVVVKDPPPNSSPSNKNRKQNYRRSHSNPHDRFNANNYLNILKKKLSNDPDESNESIVNELFNKQDENDLKMKKSENDLNNNTNNNQIENENESKVKIELNENGRIDSIRLRYKNDQPEIDTNNNNLKVKIITKQLSTIPSIGSNTSSEDDQINDDEQQTIPFGNTEPDEPLSMKKRDRFYRKVNSWKQRRPNDQKQNYIVITILVIVNLLNYIDRYTLAGRWCCL
jgi:hypothetical protein